MSKYLAPLLGIACLLWLAVWTWQLTDSYREETAGNAGAPGFSVSGEGFKFDAARSFSFPFSSADPDLPEDNDTLFQAVADFLSQHPELQLTLTGNYAKTERNKTPYPNLGLARAEAIKSALLKKGVSEGSILTIGIQVDNVLVAGDQMLGGVFFTFFEKEGESQAVPTEISEAIAVEPVPASQPSEPAPEKSSSVQSADVKTLHFPSGEYKLEDAGTAAKTTLDKLRALLRSNPTKRLLITAYASTEEEKVPNSDLAEMRARNVRRYLIDNGVRRSQVEMKFHTISASGSAGRRVELMMN
ncbi:MAG: OmpA family protein, partial [Bacteroidota bacterium]